MTSNIPSTNSLLRAHPERKSGQEACFLEIVSDSTYTKEVLSRARRLLLQRKVSFDRASFVDARDCYQVDVAMLSPYENRLADHYQLTKGSVARVRDVVDDAQECYIQEGWEKSEQENSQPRNKYKSEAAVEHESLLRELQPGPLVDSVVIPSRSNWPEWFRQRRDWLKHFDLKLGHIFVPDILPVVDYGDDDEDDDEDDDDDDHNDDDDEENEEADEDEENEDEGEDQDDDEEDQDDTGWMMQYLKGPGYLLSFHGGLYSSKWRKRRVEKLEEQRIEGEIYWCAEVEGELCWRSITRQTPEDLPTSITELLSILRVADGR